MEGIKAKMRSPSKGRKELESYTKKKIKSAHSSYKKKASSEMKEMNRKRDKAYSEAYSHMKKNGG
jgi:hypothetical protein